jgi:hypothetical protein
MSLAEYFENVEGIGVLGTADSEGNVDLALYARPHVLDDETVAFIMGDHLSHDNVTSNPHAAYLFVERAQGEAPSGYNGLRLYLTRTQEETDPKRIEAMRRRRRSGQDYEGPTKFLVHFKVEQARRLVGL